MTHRPADTEMSSGVEAWWPAVARAAGGVRAAARRRPILAAVWVAMMSLLVVQNVRLGVFMVDPSADWWLTTRHEMWTKHMCLPAYVEAADLQRQGVANVYDERYYSVMFRHAKPPLTVRNMDAFAGDPFQYPPPFLLLPRAALALTNDFLTIRTGWYVVQVVAFVAVALLLAAWVGGPGGTAAGLLVPALWLSVPLLQCLQYGQFHLTALLLAVAGMIAFERGREGLGGLLLGAAVVSKIFPAVLLLFLVVGRRWRPAAWTLAGIAAFTLAGLVVLGTPPFDAFVHYQLPRLANGQAFDFSREWPELRIALLADNLSPFAVPAKLRELHVPGMADSLGVALLRLYSLALAAIVCAAGWRGRRGGSRAAEARTWLALLNLAAFQSPGAWGDMVTVGSVWLLTLLSDEFRRSVPLALFLAASWVACAIVPGVQPIPGFLPVPVAMVLTLGITALVLGLNTWVIFSSASGTAKAHEPALACRAA